MRINDPLINPVLAPTTCHWMAVPAIIGAVATVAGTTIGVVSSIQAAQQAQAMAAYNAQVAQQNAAIQYQLQVQQAQYAAAAAQLNYQLQVTNQAIAQRNQQFAMAQAQYAQSKYEMQLQVAKQLENESNNIRARQREEARRIREQGERRQGIIVAKYGGSGVLVTEGSPLVVLADEARLTATQVQDAAYVSELESRKKLYSAEIQRFEAGFTLLEKAGYEGQAFDARMQEYGYALQAANYQNELAMANYDAKIAGVTYNMNLRQADLIRYEGEVQAGNYMMGALTTGIQGIGSLAGSFSSYQQTSALNKLLEGQVAGVSA